MFHSYMKNRIDLKSSKDCNRMMKWYKHGYKYACMLFETKEKQLIHKKCIITITKWYKDLTLT